MPRKIKKVPGQIVFRRAQRTDADTLALLGMKLWPGESKSELRAEFKSYIGSPQHCLFITSDFEGNLVGFVHGSVRSEYVEGARTVPVGYLEGIFVNPRVRRSGIGRHLLKLFEHWAMSKQCRTFASDTELSNSRSIRFHRAIGYRLVKSVAHFIKLT